MTSVAVCTVTHDAAADLSAFTAGVDALDNPELDLRVVVVDSGSVDDTVARLERWRCRWPLVVEPCDANVGFAAGMNRAIARAGEPEYVLSLNADAVPAADAVRTMVGSLSEWSARGHRLAAVTGRLHRPPGDGPARLDACGMRLALSWRHFDRGSGEIDRGQYSQPAEVFGGTGAATLFRLEALRDVALRQPVGPPEGMVFDELYHSFREDAELFLRLQERGWGTLYEPAARVQHRRTNVPRRRRRMPAAVNFHTLKNRYLLRVAHQTPSNFVLTALPTLGRDLGILAYVAIRERSSWRAYRWLWEHRAELLRRRRLIQARRTVSSHRVNGWFLTDERPLSP